MWPLRNFPVTFRHCLKISCHTHQTSASISRSFLLQPRTFFLDFHFRFVLAGTDRRSISTNRPPNRRKGSYSTKLKVYIFGPARQNFKHLSLSPAFFSRKPSSQHPTIVPLDARRRIHASSPKGIERTSEEEERVRNERKYALNDGSQHSVLSLHHCIVHRVVFFDNF